MKGLVCRRDLLLLLNMGLAVNAFAPFGVRTGAWNLDSLSGVKQKTRLASSVSGMWNAGLSYGKGEFKFYKGFDEWMKPFPEEDRQEYPEMFTLPQGVYEVALKRPLGIVFEEITPGCGVVVTEVQEGGNAANQGIIQPGDILCGVTAVKVIGAKWERRLIPALKLDFDTVVGAIGSNEERWGCDDVILQVQRPSEANDEQVKKFLEFFEPPSDSPWRN